MTHKSEFKISGMRAYNRSTAARWIWSHIWEHRLFFGTGLVGFFSAYIAFSAARIVFGAGADIIINGGDAAAVIGVSLAVLFTTVWDGVGSLMGSMSMVMLATRVERDFAPRALCQPPGQEPNLSRPAARRRYHGARHRRCAPAQFPDPARHHVHL